MAKCSWILLCLTLGALTPRDLAAVELLAHRAVYRMSLLDVARGSDVIGADGTMLYRFARGCDGWTIENRTQLRLVYGGGVVAETVWTYASWEADDGLGFRFLARYDQNGRTIERLEGRATLSAKGGGGTARFVRPEEKEVALPKGTLFPTEHMRVFVDAATAGETRLSRVVFDGASLDNPFLVNAVFAPLAADGADALAAAAGLGSVPTWWTRMAFFPYYTASAMPEFEIGANYRADGVADGITQHFDTFSLQVGLTALQALPPPDC
ncbi:MAG: EipB family protein [Rhodospirillales bacterium]